MRARLSTTESIVVRVFSLLTGVFLLSLSGTATSAKPRFLVKPPAAWVRTPSVETEPRPGSTMATGSTTLVLDDTEIRVSGASVERYYHYAQRIETTAGLDELSQLKFYFEPSYQNLIIHSIRIHRGGSIIPALKPAEIKTIQQEEELDQQLYNGTFASVVFMNDLRVGDIVDYAYTIRGENPVLGGRYADRVYLADYRATQKLRVRLLWPTERLLALRNLNSDLKPTIQTTAGETEYVWERNDVPAIPREDSTPGWAEQFPIIDLSEYKSWDDVVRWALPLYKTSPPSRELTVKIEEWKSELKTPEGRALAALRFVQDEIRYLGIELGRYSHQPNPPAKVFLRRFGDCKDKSLLLAVILNSLGIEAAPALVNTRTGKALDSRQPTPFAFNHVIVQAKLAGKIYWLDPTIGYQRGTLAQYYDPPYARALVLREGSNSLEQIPPTSVDSGSTTVNEVYSVSDYLKPVPYVVTTIYRGADADAMRYRLSSQSQEQLSKDNLNYYAKLTPSIRLDGVNQVSDDQNANAITVTERYIIDQLWNEPQHDFYADQVSSALVKPEVAQRSTPLEIEHPTSLKQTIEIDLPQEIDVQSRSGVISDEAHQLTYRHSITGRKISLEYSLKSLNDHIAAAAVGKHLDTIEQMQNSMWLQIPRGTSVFTRTTAIPYSLGKVLAFLLLPLLIVLFVLGYKRRARRQQNSDQVRKRAGDSPESAISVRTLADIAMYLANVECVCGNRPYSPEAPPLQERFIYDGRRLSGLRMKCDGCGRLMDFYFSAQTPDAGFAPGLNEYR